MQTESDSSISQKDISSYKIKALFAVALGTIMCSIDFSIANISFPILTRVFETELATVMWVSLAYSLVNICLLLVMGKISDLMGRNKIFVIGTAIFTLGLITVSLAQSIAQLILFRSFQAIGSAMIISCGPAIILDAYPAKERGKGLGLIGSSVALGFIIGPILGGFLLSWLDWRSIYYTRAPIGIIITLLSLVLLKVHIMIGTGVLILIVFIWIEHRVEDPILDLSLFKNRVFSLSMLSLFLIFLSYPVHTLIMPFYLMKGLGLSPSETGFLLSVTAMTMVIVSPASGSLSDRFGPAPFAAIGVGSSLAAFLFISRFDLQTEIMVIILVSALLGFGFGMFGSPNNSTIMGAVPKERTGTTSALIATMRNAGMSLGMALAGTVYSTSMTFHKTELIRQGMDSFPYPSPFMIHFLSPYLFR